MFIFFLLGYYFYLKAGWAIVMFMPMLAPSTFTFVPSYIMPLTIERVAFAVTVGMILKNLHSKKRIALKSILQIPFVKILLIFSIFVILLSLDDRFQNIVFTYIPRLVTGTVLCYLLIRDKNDLKRLVTIFSIHAFLISAFIIIEYFTSYNVMVWIRKTVPGYDLGQLQAKGLREIIRSDHYRAAGIDGNAVQTGYRLVFLFPIVLWYTYRKSIIGSVFIGTLAIAVIMLQTRAAFVGIGVSCISLILFVLLQKKVVIFKKFFYYSTFLLISGLLIMVITTSFFPTISNIAFKFMNESLAPVFLTKGESVSYKIDRIPLAISYIFDKPFLGHGSPHHAYYSVMNTQDLPSPFIYALAGGIPLLILYLFMIFYMPYSTYQMTRIKKMQSNDRFFLFFASAAFLGGITVVFSNWAEQHFLIMYMFYISIYKVYRPFRASKINYT